MSKATQAIIDFLIKDSMAQPSEINGTVIGIDKANQPDKQVPRTSISNRTDPISFSHLIERYRESNNPYSNYVEEYVEHQKGLILYTKKVFDWKGCQLESHTKTLLDRRDKAF